LLDFASDAPESVQVTANDFVNHYSHQFNVGFSQQFGSDLALSVDCNYNRRLACRSSRDLNIMTEPGGPRRNPKYAGVQVIGNEGETLYRELLLRFEKRYSNNWQFLASYTLGKEEDYPDGYPAHHFNAEADWGPDPTDRRHRLVLSGIATLPCDIQVSAVANLRSNLPFNTTAVTDLNGDTIGGDRPPGTTRNQGCRNLDCAALNSYRTSLGLGPVSEGDIDCADTRVSTCAAANASIWEGAALWRFSFKLSTSSIEPTSTRRSETSAPDRLVRLSVRTIPGRSILQQGSFFSG
jgi:hypothetical protein